MRHLLAAVAAVAILSGAGAYGAAKDPAAAAAPDLSALPKGAYAVDAKHGYIAFSYSHFGLSRPQLRWRSWTGELSFDPQAPEKSTVKATIDAASIDSGVTEFDGHLKSEGFFNVAQFPTITFVSTKTEKTGPTTARLTGDLTIKGVTKPVTLDATFNNAGVFMGSTKIGFSARGVVKRSDFGVDKYTPSVSDDVEIVIETEWSPVAGAAK